MNFDPKSPCYARHLGYWAVEPVRFGQAVDMIKSGIYKPPVSILAEKFDGRFAEQVSKPYALDQGVALIEINGPVLKGGGSFGEADSTAIRRAVRMATRDDDVGSILLLIDSPGGTVAGTDALAEDVRIAAETKPTHAHIEDLGASAAYWIASQTSKITATQTSFVGSIGTVAMVMDTSGKAEMEGIKVHVISTGAYKGAFAPGVPIPQEQLDYLRSQVDDVNKIFLESVRRGRKVTNKKVESWADGRTWIGDDALEMGLIDEVRTSDQALDIARRAIPKKNNRSSMTRASIDVRLGR